LIKFIQVTLPQDETSKRAPKTFKIKIKKAGEIYMDELHRFLQGRNPMTSNCLTGKLKYY